MDRMLSHLQATTRPGGASAVFDDPLRDSTSPVVKTEADELPLPDALSALVPSAMQSAGLGPDGEVSQGFRDKLSTFLHKEVGASVPEEGCHQVVAWHSRLCSEAWKRGASGTRWCTGVCCCTSINAMGLVPLYVLCFLWPAYVQWK